MKVLQINSVCGIGSTGRICTDLADALIGKGHQCMIAYGREAAPEKYSNYGLRVGTDRDVKLHAMQVRIFDNAGFASRRSTERLISDIEDYGPDIIHLHNLHGYYINIEVLFEYLKHANKPVIWTLHDCWALTGHCAHFDHVGCQKWQTECDCCQQKKTYPASYLLDRSNANFKRKRKLFSGIRMLQLVVPSRWLAGIVEKSFLRDYPAQVINNGIDLDLFRPTPSAFRETHDVQEKRIILGVASDWVEKKGFNDFIKLAEILDNSYQIVLVGLTRQQIHGLPANITGIERTNNIERLAEIYTAADIFVNPTLEEVLGLVNVEALACGTPVITYNVGGSPECIDTSCGSVVRKGNVTELASEISRMYSLGIDQKRCIQRAARFDRRLSSESYIALYENCFNLAGEEKL